jgi:hypothetical protein
LKGSELHLSGKEALTVDGSENDSLDTKAPAVSELEVDDGKEIDVAFSIVVVAAGEAQ